MSSCLGEPSTDSYLDEISSLFGTVTGRSPTVPSTYVSITMFDGLKKELAEQVQKGLSLQLDQLRKVEEKCNVILMKVPVLESRTEEVAGLKRQMEVEREEIERKFLECVDKLMEEIVQLTLRVMKAEEGMEEMKKKLEAAEAAAPPKVPLPVEVVMEPPPVTMPPPPPQKKFNCFGVSTSENDRVGEHEKEQPEPIQHERDPSQPGQFACLCGANFKRLSSFDKHLSETGTPPPLSLQIYPTRTSSRLRKKKSKEFPLPDQTTRQQPQPTPPTGNEDKRNREELAKKKRTELNSSPDIDVVHGEAPHAGRYFPYLCLCGLEFQAAGHLSVHLVLQDVVGEEPIIPDGSLQGDNLNQNQILSPEEPAIVKAEPSASSRVFLSKRDGQHGNHPALPLACICGKKFDCQNARYFHIRYYLINKNRYGCTSCSKRFVRRSLLQAHVTRYHRTALNSNTEKKLPPQSNKKRIRTRFRFSALYDREGQLHGEIPGVDAHGRFGCRCGTNYAQKSVLLTHIRSATSGTEFPCHLCPKRYSLHAGLKQHLRQTHKVSCWNKGKFICSSCAKEFHNLRQLRQHRISSHPNQ